MVSTQIRRLEHLNSLNESSLDENISLTEGILAEIKKREWFGKTAGWLHLLCFDGVCLVIGILILLMSLAEAGLAMPPFIHAMCQDLDLFIRMVRPMAAVLLLSFPLNLVLAIVKHFVPAKAEHSNGNSLEEKLRCLKENLKMIGERREWEDFCLFEWGITEPKAVCTVVCCLPALVGMGVMLVLSVIEAENIIIMIIGVVVAAAIFVTLIGVISVIYILVGYKYLSILFGIKSNVRKSAKRLLSTYDDYVNKIRVDAMSPSERNQYVLKKQQAEKEERERRAERIRSAQWEKDHKKPVVVDLDRVAARAQAIYAASRGEYHLTTEDHEVLDDIQHMHDTYGDDWTKDM